MTPLLSSALLRVQTDDRLVELAAAGHDRAFEAIVGFATEPAAELERRDEMQRALTSIAALPSRQRAALLAVAVDGRAHAEVAQELGLTDGAVRQLVHRARTTLRTTATAMTPVPLLNAVVANAGDSTVARVAEVAAGAGGAGAASVSLKAGGAPGPPPPGARA